MASAAHSATVCQSSVDTPLGRVDLLARPRGLCAVRLPGDHVQGAHRATTAPDSFGQEACLAEAARQLREYFAGERTSFDLPLDPVGTPFQLAVWKVLRTIPFGETISYGEQARRLGDRRKARAVGAANGRNPLAIVVPCHRVIGADGSLVGFASGLDAKRWLLAHERRGRIGTLPPPPVPGAISSGPRSTAGV